MRFDDVLGTVLAADTTNDFGRQSLWRQLVDLIGRRRAPATDEAMSKLRELHGQIPRPIREAGARALEAANPPVALVGLFARDDLSVAMPVLRSAHLTSAEWIELLPTLTPPARSVLRNRRDLGPKVRRALESFGPSDFVLGDDRRDGAVEVQVQAPDGPETPPEPGQAGSPFLAVGDLTRNIPAVAEAVRHRREKRDGRKDRAPQVETPQPTGEGGPFRIADVVARIDAYRRERDHARDVERRKPARAENFRFETDAAGTIRWVDGVTRAPLIGLSLVFPGAPGMSRVDAVAAGAFRRRSAFADARLLVEGTSDAAGDWQISAKPMFEPSSGRFAGYRGAGRRPRSDERAEPQGERAAAESLRQVVHELRTPAGAISGFAEMIEAQLFGPVPTQYRGLATDIRKDARNLLGVIDDLDLAARIEDASLDLHDGTVAVQPLLEQVAGELRPLALLRGAEVALPQTGRSVAGDRRAVERLLARLLATLVSATAQGERIGIALTGDEDGMVVMTFDRPQALPALSSSDDEEFEDRAMLGTGFSLRLARNLAQELGGSLTFAPTRLTLRLPAAEDREVDQARTN